MQSTNAQQQGTLDIKYQTDLTHRFKSLLNLSETTETCDYILIRLETHERFAVCVDRAKEEMLTLSELAYQVSKSMSDRTITFQSSFHEDWLKLYNPLFSYKDMQPLYIGVAKKLKLTIQLDHSVRQQVLPQQSTSLQIEIAESAVYIELKMRVEKLLNRSFKGLAFERPSIGVAPTKRRRADYSEGKTTELESQEEITVQVQSFNGKTYNTTISKHARVSQLHEQLEKQLGVKVIAQRLVYKGQQLNYGSTLSSSGVSDGASMFLIINNQAHLNKEPGLIVISDHCPLKDSFIESETIVLKDMAALALAQQEVIKIAVTLKDEAFGITAEVTDTLEQLKRRVHEQQSIVPDQQRYFYEGNELHDSMMLCECGIQEGSNLQLSLRPYGGCSGGPFVDVSNTAGISNLRWSQSAPNWRVAAPGLCIEGFCNNKQCAAHSKQVIINMYYGKYDLKADEEKCKCPICKHKVQSVTCAFNKCLYCYSGLKRTADGGLKRLVSQEWLNAGELYQYFDPNKSRSVDWKALKLHTRPRPYDGKPLQPLCPICRGGLETKFKTLVCGHKYHEKCYESMCNDFTTECLLCHF